MGNTLSSRADLKGPRETHAVFNGHFDWHSSVHGHWTLTCLLRLFPEATWAYEVAELLDKRLSSHALKLEAEFLTSHPSFERMYGWAWIMRLGIELRLLDNNYDWKTRFIPVEQAVANNAKTYLQKLDWPIRCGFHPESSFPLSQMIDWARSSGDSTFEAQLINKAKQFYESDTNYPVRYEPSGNDFFSPGLNVACLMKKIYPSQEFATWLQNYLPDLKITSLPDGPNQRK